jgi:hypothetical protein
MALVTKQYLYETVSALLEGGNPSAGKKFEPRMVQAFIQQAINRKLKTEYLSVTLPSDETIPEGLILACYDSIPVTSYKGVSRAKLPAMPVSLRKNMGVYFVGPATAGNSDNGTSFGTNGFTIESVVGQTLKVTGTTDLVIGISNDSKVITCNAFANLDDTDFLVIIGNVPIPSIDPLDGSNFFTKSPNNNFITLNNPLSTGEYIKIQSPAPPSTKVIQGIIGQTPILKGITASVTGIANGSYVVTCNDFTNVKDTDFFIIRGNTYIPSVNPLDGSNYYTKETVDNFITFNTPLATGEYLKIQII